MSKSLKASFIAIILLMAASYFYKTYFSEDKHGEIHYHAGFVVFENGNKVDFSGQKFMTVRPCEVLEDKPTPEEIQNDKGHLHGGVGDVVHIHTKDAKWGDLFKNLGYDLNSQNFTAYIDGQLSENVLEKPIDSYQSLVILNGSKDEKLLSQAVGKERIVEVEKNSIECGN
jgi:hypothetical protein